MLFHAGGSDSQKGTRNNIVRVVPVQVDTRFGNQGRAPIPENRLTGMPSGLHSGNRKSSRRVTTRETISLVGVGSFLPAQSVSDLRKAECW